MKVWSQTVLSILIRLEFSEEFVSWKYKILEDTWAYLDGTVWVQNS